MTFTTINILDLIDTVGEDEVKYILSDFYCTKNSEIENFVKKNAVDFSKRKMSITYLYIKAKEMLLHRSGTELEDMYWFDMDSATVICSKLDESNTREIRHTKAIDKKLRLYENILAMHTHPHSMPPSAEDFNSYLKAGYKMGVVLCHDGTIYRYYAFREVLPSVLASYANRIYSKVYDEELAQLYALDKVVESGDIYYEEVHV